MAALAASERLSPFMTWILAYAAGLLALTGERDMVIGIAVSSRTAEHHIQNIYTKIGVSTRAAATRWAVKHQVVVAG